MGVIMIVGLSFKDEVTFCQAVVKGGETVGFGCVTL
jgi:hypothetical protein